MLEIRNLYKEQKKIIINHINLIVREATIVSLECSSETSDVLINLILGKAIPGKGEIYIGNKPNNEYMKTSLLNIGIVLVNEGYYERLTVDSYLKFFSQLLNSNKDYKELMMKLALLDIGSVKVCDLSYAQRRRLSFARERLKDLKLLIFQEPLFNMVREEARIIAENIEELRENGVAVLSTSTSFKDTILLGGRAYTIDEYGIQEIHQETDIEPPVTTTTEATYDESNHQEKIHVGETEDKVTIEESPMFKMEKIPAKIEERMLLFNPIEIDYIESAQGISNLSVRGEKFACSLSLNELENRLMNFGFFRSHRSYLVNLQRVREIITWTRNSYSLILDDKSKSSIPLSKGRMDQLKNILNL